MKKITILLILFLSASQARAADQVYISVGKAQIKKSVLAFPNTKYISAGVDSGDSTGVARNVREYILNDLNYTNYFSIQGSDAFIEKGDAGLTLDTFRVSDWRTIGTEFLIKTGITITGPNVAYEMRLYDILGSKQIIGKRYIAAKTELLVLAHSVANDIMEALTGKPGIFLTQITMVCDKSHHKEIWAMDFDDLHPHQVTKHRSLAFAPAWSPDSKKIAYSVFARNARNIKNIDLYEYDLNTRSSKLLSNRKGMNSGARYSPDGNSIVLTMSFLGNPEIFLLNRLTHDVTQVTKSLGLDVDPVFSPDGQKIAFVSTRHDVPAVYIMNKDGTNINRVTFAGKYNATPSWTPDGKKLVFASYMENHFDLYMINPDGSELERLTKDEGTNEDPDFSPDGNFIVFDSNRTGQKNIYVISVDGVYSKRLTFGLGSCEAPKWSSIVKE